MQLETFVVLVRVEVEQCAALQTGSCLRRGNARRLRATGSGGAGAAAENLRQLRYVRPHDQLDVRRALEQAASPMRCAMQPVTPIDDVRAFLLDARELADAADNALLGVFADRARVHQDDVRLLRDVDECRTRPRRGCPA